MCNFCSILLSFCILSKYHPSMRECPNTECQEMNRTGCNHFNSILVVVNKLIRKVIHCNDQANNNSTK